MAQTDLHDLTTFRARFPHADPDNDVVQAALDEAGARIDPDDWGSLTQAGHGYLAAHILGMDVMGREERLENVDEETPYGVLFDRLARVVGCAVAPRVTG